jgi:hypothetical protein
LVFNAVVGRGVARVGSVADGAVVAGAATTGLELEEPPDEPPPPEAASTVMVMTASASQINSSPLLVDLGVLALTVNWVADVTAVGVPEISPVVVSNVNPAGSVGDTS